MPSSRIKSTGRGAKSRSLLSSLTPRIRPASINSRLAHRNKRLAVATKPKSSKSFKISESIVSPDSERFNSTESLQAFERKTPPPSTTFETSEPPEPSADQPLWEQVKAIMDTVQYFKCKAKTLEFSLSRQKEENETIQQKLKEKEKAIHLLTKKQNRLSSALQEAKKQLSSETEHGSYNELVKKVEKSAFDSRVCRTALAAAFKLVDGLKDQTTLDELLELSKNQVLSRNGVPVKKERDVSDGTVTVGIEGPGRRGTTGGIAMSQTHTKRRVEESEGSIDEPLVKTRKLGGGHSRMIVADE